MVLVRDVVAPVARGVAANAVAAVPPLDTEMVTRAEAAAEA